MSKEFGKQKIIKHIITRAYIIGYNETKEEE